MTSLETTTKQPGTVRAAISVQSLLIALGLLSAIFAAVYGDSINDAVKAELEKQDASQTQTDLLANFGGAGAGGLIFAGVSTLVFLLLVTVLGKGKQWARVTLWVLNSLSLGLALLGVLGTLALSAADEKTTKAIEAGHAAVGGWYAPWQLTYLILSAVGALAVIVLLALPASHPFFRKAAPEAVLPPEAYKTR